MHKTPESPLAKGQPRSEQGSASTHHESTALESQLTSIAGGMRLSEEDNLPDYSIQITHEAFAKVDQPKQSFTTALVSFVQTMGHAEMVTPPPNVRLDKGKGHATDPSPVGKGSTSFQERRTMSPLRTYSGQINHFEEILDCWGRMAQESQEDVSQAEQQAQWDIESMQQRFSSSIARASHRNERIMNDITEMRQSFSSL
jgi:hypothetical protein